ncbi:MAG: hypothetical protein GX827_04945 [Clostridiales bacterium]|jgi:hypothetical protein|nr:hypothetical protein [Clostridiales bacterium]
MIEAKTIQDKDYQAEACRLCGIEFDPDALAYAAVDSDTGGLLAVSQFKFGSDGFGELTDVAAVTGLGEKTDTGYSRRDILFLAGRAAMNFLDICGFHKARAAGSLARDESLAKLLGFNPDSNGVWSCDLAYLFTGEHCQ